MAKGDKQLRNLRKAVGSIRDAADADIIFFSGSMFGRADVALRHKIKKRKDRPNAILFLSTYGGSANVAYRVATAIQQNYKRFTVFVSSYCKSAGTLLALGAHEIVMTDEAEFGPLDVQLFKPDEVGERTSGLTPIQSLSTLNSEVSKAFQSHFDDLRERSLYQITTKTAADVAARLVIGCFEGIYAQIDPLRLGEIHRSVLIAEHYGARLGREGCLQKDAVSRLIGDYPSHDFIIDRTEAKKIFKSVRAASPAEQILAREMAHFVREGLRFVDPPEPLPSPLIEFITEDDFAPINANTKNEGTNGRNAQKNGKVQVKARQARKASFKPRREKSGEARPGANAAEKSRDSGSNPDAVAAGDGAIVKR